MKLFLISNFQFLIAPPNSAADSKGCYERIIRVKCKLLGTPNNGKIKLVRLSLCLPGCISHFNGQWAGRPEERRRLSRGQ